MSQQPHLVGASMFARRSSRAFAAPSVSRATGSSERATVGSCWLGAILVAVTERGVSQILLGDDPETLVRDFECRAPGGARMVGPIAELQRVFEQVLQLVDAPWRSTTVPLDLRGTSFQQRVWQTLRTIPAGSTVSYSELANRMNEPRAIRAVASACAANTLAVAIPCHRVLRANGELSGYRWGCERKRDLIDREVRALSSTLSAG